MRLILACLFLIPALLRAQETPTLNLPQFSLNISYRQDVCDRHDRYYNDELPLRDALQGFQLNTLQRSGTYLNLDDETGAINEEDPGLIADIMDELAIRAGFTWRNSFGVTTGPGENKTWADLLEWGVESYDVSVDWWVHSPERLKLGIGFPAGFIHASYIMVGITEDYTEDTSGEQDLQLWNLTKPFSRDLWIAIALTVFLSAVIYCIVEGLLSSSWKLGGAVNGTILVTLQHYQLHPKTRSGKLIGVSVAFWSLIVTATYTANLTSFFVIQNTPETTIQTLDDAISAQIPMCVWDGTALHKFVLQNYAKGIYVPTEGASGHFDGVREGKCGLALVSVNEWEQAQIDKAVNPECNLEWIGRIINFQEAGFGVKSDSGRLCTSLIKDVLNLHLVDMETDGKLGLLQDNHLRKERDIDCVAIKTAAESEAESETRGQLTLAEMAGPFVIHALGTACAVLMAMWIMLQRKYSVNGGDNINEQTNNKSDEKYDSVEKTDNTADTDRNDLELLVSSGSARSVDGQANSVEDQLRELNETLKAQREKQDDLARKQDQILSFMEEYATRKQRKRLQKSSNHTVEGSPIRNAMGSMSQSCH